MPASAPFRLVELRWRGLPSRLQYPSTATFALTGFREADGPPGTFSVYVKRSDVANEPGAVQHAKLFAVVEEMQKCLPDVGTRFMLTAGATVVADCVAIDLGTEEV